MLLLEAQAYFDREEFDPKNGYEALGARDQKIGHIQLHVAKAAMKLLDAEPEIIIFQVIPDTAIYRSQLINLLRAPVKQLMVTELDRDYPIAFESAHGWKIDEESSRKRFGEEIVLASGNLATYLERLEHGEPGDEDRLRNAVYALNAGSRGLAEIYSVDIEALHVQRLEENLGRALPTHLTSQ